MPVFPIRDIGSVGVLADLAPYNMPTPGLSMAGNVIFENGKVKRAPILRPVMTMSAVPYWCTSVTPPDDYDYLITVCTDGNWHKVQVGADTVVTPSGRAPNPGTTPGTFGFLNSVLYVNRSEDVPMYLRVNDAKLTPLSNWPSGYRARSLRTFRDFLVALNVTANGVVNGTMVKWSDIVSADNIDPAWDPTSTTNSAGENLLSNLASPLIDGCQLGDAFMLYARNEVWTMEYVGGNDIFTFRGVFTDQGIINSGCAVEVDRKHFVFGPTDIYAHDGISKISVCTDKVRRYIYTGLNVSKADRCFVHHDEAMNLLWFCYPSSDGQAIYTNPDRCNRAAVFAYNTGQWTFVDLPEITGAAFMDTNTIHSWDSLGDLTWDDLGGSWASQDDGYAAHTVFLQARTSGGTMFASDRIDDGLVTAPADTTLIPRAYIERTYLDLDAVVGPDLVGYKYVRQLWPEISAIDPGVTVYFQFGSSDTPNGKITWDAPTPFDVDNDYAVDVRTSGRFLSFRLYCDDFHDFHFSGFDADIISLGKR